MSGAYQRYRKCLRALCAAGASVCLVTLAGCAGQDYEGLRKELLTDQCPDAVKSLAEATAAVEDGQELSVVGRIFAEGISPFDASSAAFTLIELPKPGHSHDDPDDCPFCKRDRQNAATAIVQLVDASGQVRQQPANELLPVEENQDVVVTGVGTQVGDVLIVNATRLHILNAADSEEFAKQIHSQPES